MDVKTKCRLWLGFWGTAAFFSGLAFLNNLVVIVRWWRAFSAAGGDSTQMPAVVPGWFSFLDWSAVDYSGVTTLIPFVGCVCIVRGLVSILRGRPARADHFPFFASADRLNVALGLFGTLWGIIVIGYFRLDKVAMGDLMHCLHTALFSTLAAVVWVYMIDHPLVRPLMTKLLAAAGLAIRTDTSLADAVDELVARFHAASESFESRQRAYETAFADRQRAFEERFRARLEACEEACAAREAKFDAALAERLAAAEKAQAAREASQADAFAARQAAYEADREARQAAFEKMSAERLDALETARKQEAERHAKEAGALTDSLARAHALVAEIEQARDRADRQRSEAAARAETAESRLENVRNLLKG